MSQATISSTPYLNSNLFSNYYLDERVFDLDEWDCDEEAQEAMEEMQTLYEQEGEFLPDLNEDPLLDAWIDEVLDILGFDSIPEATLPEGGGYVDRTLFGSPDERLEANKRKQKGDVNGLFNRSLAVLEAKQWGHDFQAMFSEQRQYRNASHQIKHYLERTPSGVSWGVLTDGKKWRLYGTKDYEPQTYYEVDLPELLADGDVEAFKRFYVFFRAEAFRKSAGTTFLDKVWSRSESAAQELGEDLQNNVFTALRVLGEGFVETNDLDIEPGDDEALSKLKEQSLVLLYRLMFILYAESRDLIHPETPSARTEYEENFSLEALREEIKETIDAGGSFEADFSEHSTKYWGQLEDLFGLIDSGEEDLGIPPYNGGLFDPEKHEFLTDNEVANRYIAEVLYLISTTESETSDEMVFADYADLDTRHLGGIYEGLLEHQFRIAGEDLAAVAMNGGQEWEPADQVTVAEAVETVDRGELYVVNDEGERKATGAYYTPDYIVTYIVEETVDPLLDEIRSDLDEEGLASGNPKFYTEFKSRVLDLKILDPAMGSGHFLTKATEYLAEAIMAEARELVSGGGINGQQVRREVSKECIYGVDLNEMAVELAKLSMWLETLAADQPLAFLDHHLKSGNSLLGSDIETIESLETGKSPDRPDDEAVLGKYIDTKQGTIEDLMRIYQDFLALENEDLDDVKEMKQKYREIEGDKLRQRLVAMTNVRTADDFGVDVPGGGYERMAKSLEDDGEWAAVEDTDWFEESQVIAGIYDFFHWKLSFPEVFFNVDGDRQDKPGFDAVIGNPPYVRIYGDALPERYVKYLRTTFETAHMKFDLYVVFSELGIRLCRDGGMFSFIIPDKFTSTPYGEPLRKRILSDTQICSILDLRDREVFEGVTVSNLVPVLQKTSLDGDIIQIRSIDEHNSVGVTELPREAIVLEDDSSLRLSRSIDDMRLTEKVQDQSIRFDDIFYTNWGLRTGTKEKTEKYIIEETDDPRSHPMIRGKNILDSYRLQPPTENIIYEKSELYNPMFEELFESDKLVFRKISGRGLMAIADENEYYCFSTLIPCVNIQDITHVNRTGIPDVTPESEVYQDMYYPLAVVNSALLEWFYSVNLSDELSVVPEHINELPIAEIEQINDSIEESRFQPIYDASMEYIENGVESDVVEQCITSLNKDDDLLVHDLLAKLAKQINDFHQSHLALNLQLPDYLGNYSAGPKLIDLSPTPPEGLADSIMTESEQSNNKFETLRITDAEVRRDGDTVTVYAVPYVKPIESVRDDFETNSRDYATLDPEPAMVFRDLDEDQIALIESFVPYAVVNEEGGFTDNATKTISLIDRIEDITLPELDDVRDSLEAYREEVERAEELDEKIQRTDDLIDEIVYELYGLTDEEIAIVEEAVGE